MSVSKESQYKPSVEHPKTSELPKDVLSEGELKKRGVRIIQADNTNLYIREGAFAEGAPLEDHNKSGSQLTIVLVDGPSVSGYAMSHPKYAEFKNLLPEELAEQKTVDEYKKLAIGSQEEQVKIWGDYLREIEAGNKDLLRLMSLQKMRNEILSSKTMLRVYGIMSEQDIRDEMAIMFSRAAGLYRPRELRERPVIGLQQGEEVENTRRYLHNSIIFLAVGHHESKKYNVLYFTPEGELNIFPFVGVGASLKPKRPLLNQTHPDPKEFKFMNYVYVDNTSYLFGAQTPGLSLRHELEHHNAAVFSWVEKGEKPVSNEFDTDIKSMKGIRDAWEKWEQSGFTDNSGYYFVFSLPEGGYILTKHESSSGSSVSSEL